MGLYRKFFNFGPEKTVFFCIIDDKELLSIVKMRYSTKSSYNDIKNHVFESPIYFHIAIVWTKQKGALLPEVKGFFKRNLSIFLSSMIYNNFFVFRHHVKS